MAKFYGNYGYSTFNQFGYTASFQKLLYDESGAVVGEDWEAISAAYIHHQENTSDENPFLTDPNAFYGDPNNCCGINPDTGEFAYCEY